MFAHIHFENEFNLFICTINSNNVLWFECNNAFDWILKKRAGNFTKICTIPVQNSLVSPELYHRQSILSSSPILFLCRVSLSLITLSPFHFHVLFVCSFNSLDFVGTKIVSKGVKGRWNFLFFPIHVNISANSIVIPFFSVFCVCVCVHGFLCFCSQSFFSGLLMRLSFLFLWVRCLWIRQAKKIKSANVVPNQLHTNCASIYATLKFAYTKCCLIRFKLSPHLATSDKHCLN